MITNIYHCCVFKTGSQWIRSVLEHPLVKQASGLDCYRYESDLPKNADTRGICDRFFDAPLPENKILSPLFLSYECFKSIPKPKDYRAFFVSRDPRDIIVSWYFSMKYSHAANSTIDRTRNRLHDVSTEEGMLTAINVLNKTGVFKALSSWGTGYQHNKDVRLFRFEDLTGSRSAETFLDLFDYCGIPISQAHVEKILEQLSFKQLSGRKQGEEDVGSHYRKGVAGDWKNYFTPEVSARFSEATGGLLNTLGYEQT